MVFDQAEGDGLQGPGHRGDLGQDVDAVGVVLDHPLEPAHLTLNAAQPLEVSIFVLGIPAHDPTVGDASR